MSTTPTGPLKGLRMIEMGQLLSGPFCGQLMGDFGCEVIKIEQPNAGDPLREWGREKSGGRSLWWPVAARNKKCITLNARVPEGQEIIKTLVKQSDFLLENFRPGTMEKWNLGYETLSELNKGIIMIRVSGYGQTGPYKDRPGFGVIGEAMGGLRYLTGEPGRPPVRTGVSIGDTLSGLHGVIGVLMALRHREQQGGVGQEVDVALYESVFNMLESVLPEYSKFGAIRQPSGASMPGIAPTNAYLCQDGKYALIAGNGDSIYKRLMEMIGRADLANDPKLARNTGRATHSDLIDAAISAYTAQYSLDDVLTAMNAAGVPAGKSYDAADIANDPHYQARDMILNATLADGSVVQVPGIVPKLSKTPGQITRAAPSLGQHTTEVLESLGISAAQQADWKTRGVI